MMQGPAGKLERITASDLDLVIRRGETVAIVDVRRREAWSLDPEHLPGAVWLPLEEVPRRARDLPVAAKLVVYCS